MVESVFREIRILVHNFLHFHCRNVENGTRIADSHILSATCSRSVMSHYLQHHHPACTTPPDQGLLLPNELNCTSSSLVHPGFERRLSCRVNCDTSSRLSADLHLKHSFNQLQHEAVCLLCGFMSSETKHSLVQTRFCSITWFYFTIPIFARVRYSFSSSCEFIHVFQVTLGIPATYIMIVTLTNNSVVSSRHTTDKTTLN